MSANSEAGFIGVLESDFWDFLGLKDGGMEPGRF